MSKKHIAGSTWGDPLAKSIGAQAQGGASTWQPPITWSKLSRWRWRYWIGQRWQRPDYIHGGWTYQTNAQRARAALAKQFNNGDLGSEKWVDPRTGQSQAQQRQRP